MWKVSLYSAGCLDVKFPNRVNEERSESHCSLHNKDSVAMIVVGRMLWRGCCRKEEKLVRKVGLNSAGCPEVKFPNSVNEERSESQCSLHNKCEEVREGERKRKYA